MPSKREKSPAFQFYPKDFLSDPNVIRMNYAEVGMYWFLISYAWLDGCCIPSDIGALARMLRVTPEVMSEAWKSMSMCWQPHLKDCTKLVHYRLLKEFKKQQKWTEKSAEGGRKSAAKRWNGKQLDRGKGGYKMVTEKGQPNGNIAFASSTPVTPLPPESENQENWEAQIVPKSESKIRFEIFMGKYPKKSDRPAALIAWSRLQPDDEMLNQILTAIDALRSTDDWTKDGGRWIPKAARFLEDRLWQEVAEEEERFYPGHEAPWNVAGLTPEESRRIAAEYAAKRKAKKGAA